MMRDRKMKAKSMLFKSQIRLLFFLLTVACPAVASKTIYVDDDAIGANDGTSWENAFIYLQDALTTSRLPETETPLEIRVAQGTHKPNQGLLPIKPAGVSDRTKQPIPAVYPADLGEMATFQLINGFTLKGGYAGVNEPDPNERDVKLYESILSGDLSGNDLDINDPCDLFDVPDRYDNSNTVVTGSNTDATAVIDGFTITGGYFGAFTSGFAGSLIGGAGMLLSSGSPAIIDCTFTYNITANTGGGLLIYGDSNPILLNCKFTRNYADGGGGICNGRSSSPTLTNCIFYNNYALHEGGAMFNVGSKPKLTNCTFSHNSVPDKPYSAGEGGGAMRNSNSNLVMANCTFTDNKAGCGVGIHNENNSTLKLTNCILWDGDNTIFDPRPNSSTTVISYSDVQGGWPGKGNIDADPCFVNPGYWADADDPNIVVEPNDPNAVWIEGDYHLKSQAGRWDTNSQSWVIDDITSPCIDTGYPNSPIGFEPSPNGIFINMGAYGGTAEASKSPSGLHAKYGGGTGEPNDPFLIYTAEHMNTIGLHEEDWGKHFKLMADIDLGDYTGTEFNLIGIGFITPFSGVFDGNGHTISNFNYSSTGENVIGIFCYINGPNTHISNLGLIDPNVDCETSNGVGSLAGIVDLGIITNCHIIGGNVTGKLQVGGLIGICDGTITDCYTVMNSVTAEVGAGIFVGDNRGSMIDCYSTGKITGLDYIGGLVGTNVGSIVDCYSDASVEGQHAVGGLVGWNIGNLNSCYSTCNVTGTYSTGGLVGENRGSVINCYYSCSCTLEARNRVGGLVGTNDGIVAASYSFANIHGRNAIGGLVGYNTDDAEIVNCYAKGDVIGQRYVGGLVGNNATANPDTGEILSGTIRNCYSVTLVSGDQNVGGLIGHCGEDGVSGSFWDIETSGQITSAGGTGKSTVEMQTDRIFLNTGWDFVNETANGTEDIWWILEGQDYPRLWWESE